MAVDVKRPWPPDWVSPSPLVNRLTELPGDLTVRVTRTLVYEGPVSWVGSTLHQSWLMGVDSVRTLPNGANVRCTEERLEET
jgi:hypothetical protein